MFRTLTRKSTKLLIPLINEVFHTNYEIDEVIDRLDDNLAAIGQSLEMDALLRIGNRTYHVECQSNPDSIMEIRMIEYDFQMSLDSAKTNEQGIYTVK